MMTRDRIGRREFIAVLGAAAAAAPVIARAQKTAIPIIGFLASYSPDAFARHFLAAFHQGLKEAGYVEGRNVAVEYRWAEGQYDRLPALAADLVRRGVAVIVASGGTASAQVAKAATTTIPIVFSTGSDPVKLGLVASLSRPGGNLTGVMTLNVELGPKRLELLHEVVPKAASLAVLLNSANPAAENLSRDLQAAARRIGRKIHELHASTERDLDTAFENLLQLRAGGLVVGTDPFFSGRIAQLAALSIRHAAPAIYQYSFAAAGGLMSYGGNITDGYRQVGVYTGRILAGANPADLAVQQNMKVELVINLKAARALGLTVPQWLLARADEVIE